MLWILLALSLQVLFTELPDEKNPRSQKMLQDGVGDHDITEFDITESDVTNFQEFDIT